MARGKEKGGASAPHCPSRNIPRDLKTSLQASLPTGLLPSLGCLPGRIGFPQEPRGTLTVLTPTVTLEMPPALSLPQFPLCEGWDRSSDGLEDCLLVQCSCSPRTCLLSSLFGMSGLFHVFTLCLSNSVCPWISSVRFMVAPFLYTLKPSFAYLSPYH